MTSATIFGDLANLYRGPGGVLKLARDPADNDLISREAAVLRWLGTRGDPGYLPYVPSLLGTGGYRSPATGVVTRGNALGALDGFRDLAYVGGRFTAGLDPRDVAWIWRRLLVALGFAHRAGIVPRAGDCAAPRVLERKLRLLRDRLAADTGFAPDADTGVPPPDVVAAVFRAFAGRVTLVAEDHLRRLLRTGPVVFEGAQAVAGITGAPVSVLSYSPVAAGKIAGKIACTAGAAR